jgi:glycosyltransferase involved in cell wall biosynthesis
MGFEVDTSREGRRVVMLVDNGVNGDSRVQKEARSAAEAGWDVTLLGRSPDKSSHSWQIGPAEVRLLPMPTPLFKRPHEFRRHWISAPLAYPATGIGAYREQEVRAWKADLAVRRAAGPSGVRRAALRAESLAARVSGRWVKTRRGQSERWRTVRKKLDTPVDRLYAWFWISVKGNGAWRKLEPGLWDYELAYASALDKLQPDLIHANDFRMLGVAARAKQRAAAKGRDIKIVWDAHEFLPGVRPWVDNARWRPAHMAHEREYIPYADAATTVSEGLAELLQETHGLADRPEIVLNTPDDPATEQSGEPAPDLRELCGIGPEVPLLVYSGAAAPQRGLDIMIEALPQQPGVHVALVVNKPTGPYVTGVLNRAAELGVADRVHSLPYVQHWQVVPMLSGASLGVIPIHHWPNHEIALITKFFEYSHARLPLVVSDVRTMADTVRATGQGEVFRAEDLADYVRAVALVLEDPERYRAAYDKPGLLDNWTWQAQAEVLDRVYRRVLSQ